MALVRDARREKIETFHDAFKYLCRRHGGTLEGTTCRLPNTFFISTMLKELGELVEREKLWRKGMPRVFYHLSAKEEKAFLPSAREERKEETFLTVTLLPEGEEVSVTVRERKHNRSSLYRMFRRHVEEKNVEVKGEFYVGVTSGEENEYRGWSIVRWRDLEKTVRSLLAKAEGIPTNLRIKSWEWFKDKVMESENWEDLRYKIVLGD
ncbi:MAG: hypothetical protein ACTSVA_01185 [Candidatus Njordarchaeales archaeon]